MFLRILFIIQRNKHHLAFILSVILSFILIYFSPSTKYNYFRQTLNIVADHIKSPFSRFVELAKADIENQLLREQMMLLSLEKESLLVNRTENKRFKEMLDFKENMQLNLLSVKVTNMGLTTKVIAFSINCGSEQGIEVNNPVIVPNGVIGKIYSVTENSAIVQLINDSDFRIGVRILPSSTTGILRWKSNNICEIREVYKNSNINVGDRVVTSGLSDIFPENLPVGTVVSVANDRTQFQKIVSVKIYEDLNALTHVFVIINEVNNQ